MATPSPSPSPPPPQSPYASDPPSPQPTPAKKPQPIPWTHQETVHLIQAYQEKWYSLKRGQLKAGQWEEVAVTVAARCGYDYSHPSKTSTQCRHKIEKLRKRYRSEKQRVPSSWPFFHLMESLELGPLPISARPMSQIPYHHPQNDDLDDEEDDVDDEEDEDEAFSKSRSINYILRRPTIVNRFAPERKFNIPTANGAARQPAPRRREAIDEEEDSIVSKLASEIRAFADKFVGMENMKMELMKETERFRMDMENKRAEMILESQQKIVDTISRAFASRKKMKMSDDDDEDC